MEGTNGGGLVAQEGLEVGRKGGREEERKKEEARDRSK